MSDRGNDDLGDLLRQVRVAASPFRTRLNALYEDYLPVREGRVADYIPELARADPDAFGIAVVDIKSREVFEVGSCSDLFTIQSVSKAFIHGLALEDYGRDHVLTRVGVEPTGDAFNSMIKLEGQSHRPHNPMVNAGAIATAALIKGEDSPAKLKRVLEMFSRYIGREPTIDASVYTSEKTTGHRNRAIAHLLLNFGMLPPNLDEILDLYFQQCSIMVTAKDLAVMAATLANGGVNPLSGERALAAEYVQDVLSVMFSCGMYDFSGEWLYRVGLPAKSGVGGGLTAVAPGRLGIGVFSPPLDEKGNSVRGVAVCEALSQDLGLHVFSSPETWSTPG
ncbi:MAG: glutaminase A [Gammaproteobacteria bacterium]|nr:glutaminase A [Gammaproteobacteria bacterium]